MANEWILNSATNRFQLNFKRNVGMTSESIRKCSPKSVEEWRKYYYENIRSEAEIEELGLKLYVKITEVIRAEIDAITEQDCIDFIKQLVIERAYDRYTTEIQTIYGQLQYDLGCKIEPAPDEWDRLYNVDFCIEINGKYIGLQIIPSDKDTPLPEIYKEYHLQHNTHNEFTNKYQGKVFYIFSQKAGDKKAIANKEVIEDIKADIKRLKTI